MVRHFAFISIPAQGHVNPTLGLVAELVRRGHRVSFATGAEMAETVRTVGAEPVPTPFVMPSGPPSKPGAEMLEARVDTFVLSVEQTFPMLVEHFGADRPDAICADAMTTSAALTAEKLGVPQVALNPSFASNEHFSLARDVVGAGPGGDTVRTAFERFGERIAAFARSHGVEHRAGPFGPAGDLNLVFLPRELQPAAETFDESFVFLDPDVGQRPTDGHWEPRYPDRPLLLVSLGTVFNDRPEFFRTCAEAFAGDGWEVLMAVGSRVDRDALGRLASNVDIQPFVPQLRVLPRATAFVTHNGMGSTVEALYHGVPQIGVPQMPEQALIARRIEELGCGRRLEPPEPDAATLRATVDEVAADPAIRRNTERIAGRLRAGSGSATGADALEALTA